MNFVYTFTDDLGVSMCLVELMIEVTKLTPNQKRELRRQMERLIAYYEAKEEHGAAGDVAQMVEQFGLPNS